MNWQQALERTVTGLGYDLVEVERGQRGLLRVYIDRVPGDPTGESVTVDDCEQVTRQLQYVLEVEAFDYTRLEVSSPGLDRRLGKAADYLRFAGQQIELTLKTPLAGRKNYRGLLEPAEANWRLVLIDGKDEQPSPGRPKTVARPSGADAAGVLGSSMPPSPGRPKTVARPSGADAAGVLASSSRQVLDFSLDEVREARLVPVIDFKGRAKPARTQSALTETCAGGGEAR